MSYEIVKGIAIKKNKVFIRSSSNNIYPKDYTSVKHHYYTKILNTEGKEELYKEIGKLFWNGSYELRKGSKICDLFIKARSLLPQDYGFDNLDSEEAGKFLANAVLKLEKDKDCDLSKEVEELKELRNNKEYILKGAKNSGRNFLEYANKEIQEDRDFALEVLKASGGVAWFKYPKLYINDKDFALEALQLNGCFYRELSKDLRKDHDIILKAFDNSIDRIFVEHLPDCIPLEAFYYGGDKNTQPLDNLDKQFLLELMEKSPKMHMNRAKYLLVDSDCAIKWYKVSRYKKEAISLIMQTQDHENINSKWFQEKLLETCQSDLDKKLLLDLLKENNIYMKISEKI